MQQGHVTTQWHPDLDLHSSAALVWKPLTCVWMPSFSRTRCHLHWRLFPIQVNNFLILINSEVDPWNGFTGLEDTTVENPTSCLSIRRESFQIRGYQCLKMHSRSNRLALIHLRLFILFLINLADKIRALKCLEQVKEPASLRLTDQPQHEPISESSQ